MLAVSVLRFVWRNPLAALVGAIVLYILAQYAASRWRKHRAIVQYRLCVACCFLADDREQRRRAGIPDSDTRPWMIARPAAELRRREEAAQKLAEEAKAASQAAYEAKKAEVEQLGHKVVHTLRRMQSTESTPRRRVDRRYEE